MVLMLGVGIGAVLTRICQQLDSISSQPIKQPNSVSSQPVKWKTLGVNVQPVARDQLPSSSRYRGGLRIVDVRSGSPAARQGIRKDDILVGLHRWEMKGPDDLEFAMRKAVQENLSPVKFYVLRGEETLSGHIDLR